MIIILFIISQWISFLNSKEIYDMADCGDSLLIGTTSGALIFNKKDTSFTHITNVNGLLSNDVRGVEIDHYGNFWFLCSGSGITLMRGNKRRNFTSIENLPSYDLSSLFIDGDTVWVGTSDNAEVWMYDMQGDPFTGDGSGKLFDIKPTNEVECIQVIGDSIWFGTHKGIGVMKKGGDSFRVYNTDSGLPNDTVLAIAEWDGYVWAGTIKGSARLGPSGWEIVDANYWCPSENDTIWIRGYGFYGSATEFWAATSFGAKKWEYGWWSQISWMDTRSVSFDSCLWMGTFGNGICSYDGADLHSYIPEGPASNVFSSIAVDLDGNLWSTHDFTPGCVAVSKLYNDGTQKKWKWKIYNHPNEWGRVGGGPTRVLVDKVNNAWVMMRNWDPEGEVGVVKIMPNDSIIKLKIDGGANANCITTACLDTDDNVWIGCGDGYIRRIRNDVVDTAISNDYTKNVTAIWVSPDGCVWVGDRDSGLWIFLKEGGLSRVSGIPIEPIKFIKSFGEEVWVGTDSDIYRVVDREVTISYTKVDMGGTVQDIAKDLAGGIWFAVKDVGIKRLKPDGMWEHYGIEDGLVDKEVLRLGFDEKQGVLWIGTIRGVSRFEAEIPLPKPEVKVYPNPFVFSKHKDNGIIFKEVCEREFEEINIYTLSGKKVRTIRESTTWDVKNESNEFVASGVYIFAVYIKGGERRIGKIAIIR